MRSLRWVGLVFSLLIVGVVGGLMAPPHSDAGLQKVTIQLDSGSATDITSSMISIATGTTQCPTGNICFGFPKTTFTTLATPTKPARQFQMVDYNNSSATPSMLRIVDTNGCTNCNPDSLSVSTFQLQPVGGTAANFDISTTTDCNENTGVGTGCTTRYPPSPYYGEVHNVILKVTWIYNAAPNPATTCGSPPSLSNCSNLWKFVLGVSGQFRGNGAGNTTSGDMVRADAQALLGNGSTLPTRLVAPAPPVTNAAEYRTGFAPIPYNIGIGPTITGTPTACNAANSRYDGTGTGKPDVDWCPLKKTVGPVTDLATDFGVENLFTTPKSPKLTQGKYTSNPSYICNTGNNQCAPTVTATVQFALNGADTWVATSSLDGVFSNCDDASGQKCGGNGNNNLDAKIEHYYEIQAKQDANANKNDGTKNSRQCEGNECPCLDLDLCTGTIVIVADESPNTANLIFPFLGDGQGIDPSFKICSLTPNPNPPPGLPTPETQYLGYNPDTQQCDGQPGPNPPESQTFEVPISSPPWIFTYDRPNAPRVDANTFWDADSIACQSVLNNPNVIPPIIVSTWEVESGSVKTFAKVTKLGKGDTVTCDYHIHKNSPKPK